MSTGLSIAAALYETTKTSRDTACRRRVHSVQGRTFGDA